MCPRYSDECVVVISQVIYEGEDVGDIGCVCGIGWLGTNTPCEKYDTTGSCVTMGSTRRCG